MDLENILRISKLKPELPQDVPQAWDRGHLKTDVTHHVISSVSVVKLLT